PSFPVRWELAVEASHRQERRDRLCRRGRVVPDAAGRTENAELCLQPYASVCHVRVVALRGRVRLSDVAATSHRQWYQAKWATRTHWRNSRAMRSNFVFSFPPPQQEPAAPYPPNQH